MKEFKSPRLERVYKYLCLHGKGTTKELEDKCGVASARDYVRRLRDRGMNIKTIELGMSEQGARIVQYALACNCYQQEEPVPDCPQHAGFKTITFSSTNDPKDWTTTNEAGSIAL